MDNTNKYRLLYIQKLLQNTDEQHPLTNAEMTQMYEDEFGVSVHRTTIPEDIEVLIESGMEIEVENTRPKKYYLNEYAREFTTPELKLLVDAVASSKFITKSKSDELIEKITKLASPSNATSLKRNLWTEDRIKKDNEKIYLIVDVINEAINEKKKISFLYFQYDENKERKLRHNGEPYIFSPYALVWNGDYYYVVGFSDSREKICTFRVDRIASTPLILDEKAVKKPKDFSVSKFVNGMIHMYDGERTHVQLVCDNSVMDSIIDKFGIDAKTKKYDDNNFLLDIEIAVNDVFNNWVNGFNGLVKVLVSSK